MSNRQADQLRELAREKAVFQYTAALERGDFETITTLLAEAEGDALLEQMILEVNEVLTEEYAQSQTLPMTLAEDAEQVRQIVDECLTSAISVEEDDLVYLPPLTVSTVFAQMQEDSSLQPQLRREAATIQQAIRSSDVPLPSDLTQRNVRQLFRELGMAVETRLEKVFRQAAIFLSMGREQQMAQLAATRRQRRTKTPNPPTQGEE
jgi:hypothetical protein